MKANPILCFLLCNLLASSSMFTNTYAQFSTPADALYHQFNNRIDSATKFFKEYKYNLADSLIQLNIENEHLTQYPKINAESIYLKGNILIKENKLTEAKNLFSQLLNTAKNKNDTIVFKKVLLKFGETHSRMNKLNEAESIFLKAEKVFTEYKDNYGLAQCYRHLSIIKSKKKNYVKSIDFLYKSLIFIDKIEDDFLLITTTINLGIVYLEIKNYDKATENLTKGLELAKKHHDHLNIIFSEYKLGIILYDRGLMNQAINKANQIIKFTKENNLEKYNFRPYLIMAGAYLELCQLDKAKYYCSLILNTDALPIYTYTKAQVIACRIAFEEALYEQVINDCSEIIESDLNILDEKLFEVMYNAHLNLKNYKEAILYGDLFRKASTQTQANNFNTYLTKQEINIAKERVSTEKLLNQKNWLLVSLSIIGVLLLLTTTLFIMANQSKKKYNAELKEQVKQRTQELKQSNLDLARFAHIASHDIKAPILTIKAFSELLEAEAQKLNNENIKKFTKMINSSSIEASKLVEDTLEFSKLNYKHTNVVKINLKHLISKIETIIDEYIKINNAQINIPPDLPTITANETLLGKVLKNIIENGIKYNKNVTPTIYINVLEHSSEHEIIISDNGIGINKKHHKSIFNIFYRLHPKNEFEGTGVGLAICKRIIKSMNGKIWVMSEVGKGSAFHILLPK